PSFALTPAAAGTFAARHTARSARTSSPRSSSRCGGWSTGAASASSSPAGARSSAALLGQVDVVEEIGAGLLGWCTVDEEDELLVAFVPDLERRHRLDRDDALRPDVDALGRIAEQHR